MCVNLCEFVPGAGGFSTVESVCAAEEAGLYQWLYHEAREAVGD